MRKLEEEMETVATGNSGNTEHSSDEAPSKLSHYHARILGAVSYPPSPLGEGWLTDMQGNRHLWDRLNGRADSDTGQVCRFIFFQIQMVVSISFKSCGTQAAQKTLKLIFSN